MFKNRNLQSFGSTPEAQRLGLIDFLEEVKVSKYLEQQLSDEQIAEIAEAMEDWPSLFVMSLWSLFDPDANPDHGFENSKKLHTVARKVIFGAALKEHGGKEFVRFCGDTWKEKNNA